MTKATKNMNAGVAPCADVRARIIDNVSKTGPLTYKPTTLAVRLVEAAVR